MIEKLKQILKKIGIALAMFFSGVCTALLFWKRKDKKATEEKEITVAPESVFNLAEKVRKHETERIEKTPSNDLVNASDNSERIHGAKLDR